MPVQRTRSSPSASHLIGHTCGHTTRFFEGILRIPRGSNPGIPTKLDSTFERSATPPLDGTQLLTRHLNSGSLPGASANPSSVFSVVLTVAELRPFS